MKFGFSFIKPADGFNRFEDLVRTYVLSYYRESSVSGSYLASVYNSKSESNKDVFTSTVVDYLNSVITLLCFYFASDNYPSDIISGSDVEATVSQLVDTGAILSAESLLVMIHRGISEGIKS